MFGRLGGDGKYLAASRPRRRGPTNAFCVAQIVHHPVDVCWDAGQRGFAVATMSISTDEVTACCACLLVGAISMR